MNSPVRRLCRHCLRAFVPDYRNVDRQHYCSKLECRGASKRASQRKWLRKPANRNYFRDAYNTQRVQAWRKVHPGYWRCSQVRSEQPVSSADSSRFERQQAGTLQDFCRSRSPVLMGLILGMQRCELQEDIARCATQVVCEAQCILLLCQTSISAGSPMGNARTCHDTG